MNDVEKELLVALKLVRAAPDPFFGICYNVTLAMPFAGVQQERKVSNALRDLFEQWPEFSGSRGFPVPCEGYADEAEIFLLTTNYWVGEYGEARKRLLNFMIETLENKQN